MIYSKTGNLKQRKAGKIFGIALAGAMGGLLLAGTNLQAQQMATGNRITYAATPQAAAPQVVAKPQVSEEKEESAEPQKPGHEGLKVHGHWKIVAMNPDGTGKKTYEFENSLVSANSGDKFLVSLLSGQGVAGEWSIQFSGTGGGLCGTKCVILNNSSSTDPVGHICTFSGYVCFPGMTTTITPAPASTNVSTGLTFSGTFTAASAGSITTVYTVPEYCVNTSVENTVSGVLPYNPAVVNFSPATCAVTVSPVAGGPDGFQQTFTATSLGTAFSFASGQLVQVSVTITFS